MYRTSVVNVLCVSAAQPVPKIVSDEMYKSLKSSCLFVCLFVFLVMLTAMKPILVSEYIRKFVAATVKRKSVVMRMCGSCQRALLQICM